MNHYVDDLALFATALLFIGGVILLGFGAFVWARAQADVFRVISHKTSAETQRDTIASAEDAIGSLRDYRHNERPPTDAELRASAREDAENERFYAGEDVTTTRNEMGEDVDEGIDADELYLDEEDEEQTA